MIDSTYDPIAIAQRLASIKQRIAQACERTGRSPNEVILIAVTKTFPPALIDTAYEVGLRDFGENRVQELSEKAQGRPGVYKGGGIQWHMIGHLQRNKAQHVVAHADLFHALDSLRLAKTLNQKAREQGRHLSCLVQVNVSGEASKFGIAPHTLSDFLDALASYTHLHILGLMAIAAYTPNPEDVRPSFRALRLLKEQCAGHPSPNIDLKYLSMGMSNDFEVAIEEGATHIRLGTALFGLRS